MVRNQEIIMSKLWKVEIPFDSSNRFPDMLKTMLLFFDKTVVRLPMIGAGEPFYNKKEKSGLTYFSFIV